MVYIVAFVFIAFAVLKIWIFSPRNVGRRGENRVSRKLSRLSGEYVILNDVLLPTDYGTTQVDHIVVSPYGIFVIETKNYKGWIFGHENSEEWKQSLLGRKTFFGWSSVQYKFRNPVRQNIAHVLAIKSLLMEIGNFQIIPIVVFSNNAELNVKTPNNIVINWYYLLSVIKSYRAVCITPEDVSKIVSRISSLNITDKGCRKNHISNIQSLQQKKNMYVANGRCPKCGGYLVQKKGQYGMFLGCSNYPRCRYTHNL